MEKHRDNVVETVKISDHAHGHVISRGYWSRMAATTSGDGGGTSASDATAANVQALPCVQLIRNIAITVAQTLLHD